MLSRALRRTLLDTKHQLPPTFLLPWAANLSTASAYPSTAADAPPPPATPALASITTATGTENVSKVQSSPQKATDAGSKVVNKVASPASATRNVSGTSARLPEPNAQDHGSRIALSPSVRQMLPLMRAQGPHYITVHIQGNPYLVTEGDTVRLPYLMHDVEPGDVLRLNRAINLGSRDYTLKAPAPAPKLKSSTASSQTVLDPTTGTLASYSQVMPDRSLATTESSVHAPHFIPHIAKGKYSYIDDRLFVCRALVMGVESEPMRIKEKTKRRQRHVRKVKSKHRYTILKIKELRIKSLDELESEVE